MYSTWGSWSGHLEYPSSLLLLLHLFCTWGEKTYFLTRSDGPQNEKKRCFEAHSSAGILFTPLFFFASLSSFFLLFLRKGMKTRNVIFSISWTSISFQSKFFPPSFWLVLQPFFFFFIVSLYNLPLKSTGCPLITGFHHFVEAVGKMSMLLENGRRV